MHVLILILLTSAAEPETFTCKVVTVRDGDSIVVQRDNKQIEIRLREIDCPESGQPYGQQAKQQTSTLCLGRIVTVHATGQDRHGRTLAFVILPGGNQLNRELIRLGAAWWYRKYSTDPNLQLAQAEASGDKVGLWAADNPIPPWDWRLGRRNGAPEPNVEIIPNGVGIVGLLPNPRGQDPGKEQVMIANATTDAVELRGWRLVDRAGNQFVLSGIVQGSGRLTITMSDPSMPLNNDGDDVLLVDAKGVARSKVSYAAGISGPSG